MKISKMGYYDKFWDDEYVCWVEVDDIPKIFIEKAKEIDKENYSKDCFGICVAKSEDDDWCVCQESFGCELYYIDNNGDKHWMEYLLNDIEKDKAIEFCSNYVKRNEGVL